MSCIHIITSLFPFPHSHQPWDSPAARDRLVFESSEDAEDYLAAVASLVGATSTCAKAALQVVMARLEEVFRHLLIHGTSSLAAEDLHASLIRQLSLTVPSFSSSASDLDWPSFTSHAGDGDESAGPGGRTSVSDDEILPYLISPDTISTLKDITGVMLQAGYALELCLVYNELRGETLMECLAVLGVDKMRLEEVQCVE